MIRSVRNLIYVTLTGFVLTACGGGGGGSTGAIASPSPSAIVTATSSPVATSNTIFQQPAVLANGNLRLARIDYRYDTPADSYNTQGYQTTSYEALTPLIDNMKAVGFNGIVIDNQAPVNAQTGKISTTDFQNVVKNPPKDMWRVIDYAKSQGMQVWLSLAIVDSVTDCNLSPDFTKYSEQDMFYNVAQWDIPLAILAQNHKVDGIFVSEGNWQFDTDAKHIPYWQYLINQIKSVYSGKLAYNQAMLTSNGTPIYNYVDYIGITLSNGLSTSTTNDLQTIVKMYNNDVRGMNEVSTLRNIYNTYGKKLLLTNSSYGADSGVNVIPDAFFNSMTANFLNVSSSGQPLVSYNGTLKSLKTQAFLEMVALNLSDIVVGETFGEYGPWILDTKFSNPNGIVYLYYSCGDEISYDKGEQQMLNEYFSKPWGYHTLTTSN